MKAKEETWDQRRKRVGARFARYEAGNLALTKGEIAELYKEQDWVISNCPHDVVLHKTGSWTDSGYGLDRHVPCEWSQCEFCAKVLSGTRGDGDDSRVVRKETRNAIRRRDARLRALREKKRAIERQIELEEKYLLPERMLPKL
jgi:hypothetical protein